MISVGSYRARDCQGLTRRAFVQMGAALPFASAVMCIAGLWSVVLIRCRAQTLSYTPLAWAEPPDIMTMIGGSS